MTTLILLILLLFLFNAMVDALMPLILFFVVLSLIWSLIVFTLEVVMWIGITILVVYFIMWCFHEEPEEEPEEEPTLPEDSILRRHYITHLRALEEEKLQQESIVEQQQVVEQPVAVKTETVVELRFIAKFGKGLHFIAKMIQWIVRVIIGFFVGIVIFTIMYFIYQEVSSELPVHIVEFIETRTAFVTIDNFLRWLHK